VDYAFRVGGHLFWGEGSITAMAFIIPGRDANKLARNPADSQNPFGFKNA